MTSVTRLRATTSTCPPQLAARLAGLNMGKEVKRNAKSKQDRAAAAAKADETGDQAALPVVNATALAQYHRHAPEKLGKIKKKNKRVSLSRTKASRRHLVK
jgi:hypothetical protein